MRKYRARSNCDPRKVFARYKGKCSCGVSIARGDVVVYYPLERKVVCLKCGIKSLEAIQDEDLFVNRSL